MARHNEILLNGFVVLKPIVEKDNNTAKITRVTTKLLVIAGNRAYGDFDVKTMSIDYPLIITGDPVQTIAISQWNVGDFVEVKGTFTTSECSKVSHCPCGEKNLNQGLFAYISPIYSRKIYESVPDDQWVSILKENCEISNTAQLVGTVCREPSIYFSTGNSLYSTSYQLVVWRKFKINDETSDKKTDFPWVKSYGLFAKKDFTYLKKGSLVLIDGFIRTREIKRKVTCSKCGAEYKKTELVAEIVPYCTEFLGNFRTDAEAQLFIKNYGEIQQLESEKDQVNSEILSEEIKNIGENIASNND